MYQFKEVFRLYKEGKCSPEQAEWLFDAIRSPNYQEELKLELEEEMQREIDERDLSALATGLSKDQLPVILSEIRKTKDKEATIIRKLVPYWWWVASFIAVALSVSYWLLQDRSEAVHMGKVAGSVIKLAPLPGSDKATVTLADGTVINLDENNTDQERVRVEEEEGEAVYMLTQTNSPQTPSMQTVYVPKGEMRRFVLPDGSHVWLNAASKLIFDANFVGENRTVELIGEGYFEVASMENKPFHVVTGDQTVRVLGTKFNVTAYENSLSYSTTLFEGKVQVQTGQSSVLLEPGMEAVYAINTTDLRSKKANLEKQLAWRNREFYFIGNDIQSIAHDLSRWYNVAFEVRGDVDKHRFTGNISKNRHLEEVLDILKRTNDIQYEIIIDENKERRVKIML